MKTTPSLITVTINCKKKKGLTRTNWSLIPSYSAIVSLARTCRSAIWETSTRAARFSFVFQAWITVCSPRYRLPRGATFSKRTRRRRWRRQRRGRSTWMWARGSRTGSSRARIAAAFSAARAVWLIIKNSSAASSRDSIARIASTAPGISRTRVDTCESATPVGTCTRSTYASCSNAILETRRPPGRSAPSLAPKNDDSRRAGSPVGTTKRRASCEDPPLVGAPQLGRTVEIPKILLFCFWCGIVRFDYTKDTVNVYPRRRESRLYREQGYVFLFSGI